ncbi:MAG: protein kinase, partial [Ruminococcus sp.]|nr:protein kinase [Ruminococcus sp.]
GICKLGDFGTFSCLEPSRTSIAFKRTQYYMAPEFINSGKINCTVDTYSLGLVLYSLVNRGRLPFTEAYPQEVTINGLDRSKMNRLNGVELPKPLLASDALFAVISKACAYKEEDRYLSPKQMYADLKNVLENKPFEKAEYDDVYSVSQTDESEKDEIPFDASAVEYKPLGETVPIAPTVMPVAAPEPVKEEHRVSLKEEISIPDVSPSDYAAGKKPMKKRHVAYSSIPEVKPKRKKSSYSDVKKLIILAAAVLIVLVLLLVSIALRAGSGAPEQESIPAVISQNIFFLLGVITNGG